MSQNFTEAYLRDRSKAILREKTNEFTIFDADEEAKVPLFGNSGMLHNTQYKVQRWIVFNFVVKLVRLCIHAFIHSFIHSFSLTRMFKICSIL